MLAGFTSNVFGKGACNNAQCMFNRREAPVLGVFVEGNVFWVVLNGNQKESPS